MMKFNLDLEDLRKRESERIEWKKNVANIDAVIETIVAFSNDFSNLGGGYVICGAEEVKDVSGFQSVNFLGLGSDRFKEIEGKVLSDCQNKVDPPIVPIIDEIALEDTENRVLVFIVPSTDYAHNFRSSGEDASKYYIRIGRSTREARGPMLRELLVRKKALEPWDRRANKSATTKDIDLLVLREYMQKMTLWDPSEGIEKYLSHTESISAFVPPFLHSENMIGKQCCRNFTLLLFCTNPTKFFQGAYTILSVYPGTDRSVEIAERYEITGTIVQQTQQLLSRLNIESQTAFDKTTPNPNQLKYPQRAIQEALVNSLVHRDYESDQPTRVTIFSDRIEINSPGPLPRTIDKNLFAAGKAAPFWRNQSLAFFFNKLQLAQAEGQGIPTIIRTMREEGCPDPQFLIGEDNLICTLPAHPRHLLLSQIRNIENDIVIGNHKEALVEIETLLNEDPSNYRLLELYCEACQIVHKPELVGKFILSNDIYFDEFSPSTLIIIAETIILIEDQKGIQKIADKLLNLASKGKLEEKEIKKVAIGIRKLGNDEKAIQFIDRAQKNIPALRNNSSLLEIRAKAKIELAKRCIDTARKKESSPKIKGRAWDQCRYYLEDANKDLNNAMHNTDSSVEKDFIQNDLQFLKKLQGIAKKPQRRKPHFSGPKKH